MIDLDGSAGGGQLVRTALTLSAITGRPFAMSGIRAERSTPGLQPQHLAVLHLFADLCDAELPAVSAGDERVEFEPEAPDPGHYEVDIGTAGSIGLLFDAVCPVGVRLDRPLRVTATGGTDVKWAPTLGFVRHVKLPLLRAHGLVAVAERRRPGFYPAGGGEATLTVGPSDLGRFDLTTPGSLEGTRVYSLASESLAERDVARRQASAAVDTLAEAGHEIRETAVVTAQADSPGSAVVVGLDFETGRAGTDALGERATPAETVGETAAAAAIEHLDSGAVVDRHLADQLVLPVGLAGGAVSIPAVTDHVAAAVDLVRAFGIDVEVESGSPPRLVAPGTRWA